MSKGKKTLLIIAALVVLVVGGYKLRYPTYSWHQKLTVEIETPQGVVTGSSVVSVVWRSGPKILPDPPSVTHHYYGEATVVKLPNDRYVFALLKGASTLALRTFATSSLKDTTDSRIVPASEVNAHDGETRPVPTGTQPMLVTFTDINDPKTVKWIGPYDFVESFGEGYSLKAITLEITDEPVTKGVVEGVLGWIGSIRGRIKPTKKRYAYQLTPEEKLYSLDFIRR